MKVNNNKDIGPLVEIPLNDKPKDTDPKISKVVYAEIDKQSVIKPSSIKDLEKSRISDNDNSPAAKTAKKIDDEISLKLSSMNLSKEYEGKEIDPTINFD